MYKITTYKSVPFKRELRNFSLIYKYNIPKIKKKSLFVRPMLRKVGWNQWSSTWQHSPWGGWENSQNPPSCCACSFKPLRGCLSTGTERLLWLCWCQTELEQPCRGRPSEVKANTSSMWNFPGHYLSCLSLQNYRTSSPRLLLSSSSSSFSSHSALSQSLRGRPAFVFCDWKSFLPSLSHHHCTPRSCSPHLSGFLHIYGFYFSSSSPALCLL